MSDDVYKAGMIFPPTDFDKGFGRKEKSFISYKLQK
jgi:hypothetical protein